MMLCQGSKLGLDLIRMSRAAAASVTGFQCKDQGPIQGKLIM